MLAHFYLHRTTVIETDTTDIALGWILGQYLGKLLHPVGFHSRKLYNAEQNYEIHDNQLLAILEAFCKWQH